MAATERGRLSEPAGSTRPRARRQTVVIAIVALAVIAGAAVGLAIGLTKTTRTDNDQSAVVGPKPVPNPGQSTPSPSTSTTAASSSTPSITTQQVQLVLDRYAAAYSARSPGQLLPLFAPTLIRRNAAGPPETLSQALTTYRTQFSQLQNPKYTLSNVQMAPGQSAATADATYTITSQNGTVTGSIVFHLVPTGTGLRIDQITIQPNP